METKIRKFEFHEGGRSSVKLRKPKLERRNSSNKLVGRKISAKLVASELRKRSVSDKHSDSVSVKTNSKHNTITDYASELRKRSVSDKHSDSVSVKTNSKHNTSTDYIELSEVINNEEKNWKDVIEAYTNHISDNIKNSIILDLEELIYSSDWPPEEMVVTKESTLTFMKLIMFLKPEIPPILGCDHGGNVIMHWGGKDEHLRFTCFSDDFAIYYVSYKSNKKTEEFSGYKQIIEIKEDLNTHKDILFNKFFNKLGVHNHE